MRRHSLLLSLLLLLLLQISLFPAQATDISVLFQPLTQTATPGSVINYNAIFTNNTATDLWINGATLDNFSSPDFLDSGSSGFFNSPFQLLANQTRTVSDVLSLQLDGTLPAPATYTMDATFTGLNYTDYLSGTGNGRELGTGSLALVATAPIPEPPFYQMSALLALGGFGVWRRRRQP